MHTEQTNLYLAIQNRSKGIPYGAGDHPDGSKNHGYKRLKGNKELALLIPEAQDTDALRNALVRLNDPITAFFTVGCEKSCQATGSGFSVTGYVELAFNFIELVADPQYYFQLFFAFHGAIFQSSAETSKAKYLFELAPAHFLDGPANGFTVAVWISTLPLQIREEALHEWGQAVLVLVDFLESVPLRPGFSPIYYPEKQLPDLD